MTEQRNDRSNGRDAHGRLKRPPAMGELKRQADAQAPTLRAELRARMHGEGLTVEDVARGAGLDGAALMAFLDGASLNPRWQARLARWLEGAGAP